MCTGARRKAVIEDYIEKRDQTETPAMYGATQTKLPLAHQFLWKPISLNCTGRRRTGITAKQYELIFKCTTFLSTNSSRCNMISVFAILLLFSSRFLSIEVPQAEQCHAFNISYANFFLRDRSLGWQTGARQMTSPTHHVISLTWRCHWNEALDLKWLKDSRYAQVAGVEEERLLRLNQLWDALMAEHFRRKTTVWAGHYRPQYQPQICWEGHTSGETPDIFNRHLRWTCRIKEKMPGPITRTRCSLAVCLKGHVKLSEQSTRYGLVGVEWASQTSQSTILQ